jgi:hypothetical protein
MNESTPRPEDELDTASREQLLAALFANMVIQQTNMAMMLLGKVAHPETGKFIKDIESAKMFIDQLEMLEAKTKGNLSKQEEGLLKQALSALHMSFVEAVDAPETSESSTQSPTAAKSEPERASSDTATPPTASPPSPPADESRKKFTKKY